MTKFERVGLNIQSSAVSKEDARQKFRYSCRVCCERGMHLDCDKCAIAAVHEVVLAAFEPYIPKVQ